MKSHTTRSFTALRQVFLFDDDDDAPKRFESSHLCRRGRFCHEVSQDTIPYSAQAGHCCLMMMMRPHSYWRPNKGPSCPSLCQYLLLYPTRITHTHNTTNNVLFVIW
ncbi:unnamed protein product, partial [Ectocarpus sp. 6 AP-2014]